MMANGEAGLGGREENSDGWPENFSSKVFSPTAGETVRWNSSRSNARRKASQIIQLNPRSLPHATPRLTRPAL
jgi:hypothetical protein